MSDILTYLKRFFPDAEAPEGSIVKVYAFGSLSFETWYSNNRDVTHLVLEGVAGYDAVSALDDIIDNLKGLDVTGLLLDADEEECFVENVYEESWTRGHTLRTSKIILNRHRTNTFLITPSAISSVDGKVLVHAKSTDVLTRHGSFETIGDYAFCDNDDIAEACIPEGIKVIGAHAFSSCYWMKKLELPDSLLEIGEYAFDDCGIYTLFIPPHLESIPDGCFSHNYLCTITYLGNSVKYIGVGAFEYSCTGMDITIPEGVEEIEMGSYGGIKSMVFPSTIRKISKSFYIDEEDYYTDIPHVTVHPDNPYFFSREGTLFSYDQPDRPYLGISYQESLPKQEPLLLPPEKTEEHSLEEIYGMYSSCRIYPIDSGETKFWVYEDGKYNIIDRCLNRYFNCSKVEKILVSKDHFIIVNNQIYDLDCRTVLLDSIPDTDIYYCDDKGLIFATRTIDKEDKETSAFTWSPTTQMCGCIDKEGKVVIPFEYRWLGTFDYAGYLVAKKGTKYGCIDINNRTLIPFMYWLFYRDFGSDINPFGKDSAIVHAGPRNQKKFQFINHKNEVLGEFVDQQLWEKGFHIYRQGNRYGYTKQFGMNGSLPIYKEIKKINDETIQVTQDGLEWVTISYRS